MTEQADPRIAEMITKVFSSFLKKKKKNSSLRHLRTVGNFRKLISTELYSQKK